MEVHFKTTANTTKATVVKLNFLVRSAPTLCASIHKSGIAVENIPKRTITTKMPANTGLIRSASIKDGICELCIILMLRSCATNI